MAGRPRTRNISRSPSPRFKNLRFRRSSETASDGRVETRTRLRQEVRIAAANEPPIVFSNSPQTPGHAEKPLTSRRPTAVQRASSLHLYTDPGWAPIRHDGPYLKALVWTGLRSETGLFFFSFGRRNSPGGELIRQFIRLFGMCSSHAHPAISLPSVCCGGTCIPRA